MFLKTRFTRTDNQSLHDALRPLVAYKPLVDPDISQDDFLNAAFVAKTETVSALHNSKVLPMILDFKRLGNRGSFLHIKNTSTDLEPLATPKSIQESAALSIAHPMLAGLAMLFNDIAPKRFENTIRFPVNHHAMNEEPWHGHPDYGYTLFYCQHGDPNAQTRVLCAETIAKLTFTYYPEGLDALFKPQAFIPQIEPFALIQKSRKNGYIFASELNSIKTSLLEHVDGLDLPDMQSCLKYWRDNSDIDDSAKAALTFMMTILTYHGAFCDKIMTYERGDIVIFNEKNTARYSQSFQPSDQKNPRWLQSLSVF